MSAGIQVDGVCAGYNGTRILNGVSVALEAGDFLGVIGPNGSGKTTLLRVMSRALPPESGHVNLSGKSIYSIPAREFARRVAVVPQDTLVAFDFSVLDIVLMGRSCRLGRFSVEGAKDYEIAREALALTGTAHLADRQINALSGGERQRVMMARALAQEPEVLLLDEPTSHLDISFQYEIMDLVRRLNRDRGLTVLAVLHDLNLAGQYCDRLVMVGSGTVQAGGSPEEVITPKNIRHVYGAEVWVRKHPTTGRPYIISGIRRGKLAQSADFENAPRVHVIGGGGSGAPIMAKLARRGYEVTSCVLTEGDADSEVAEALDITYVPQPQFASISEELHSKHMELIGQADLILLADVPVGSGNLHNIQAALAALRSGKTVALLQPEMMKSRDFTGGEAVDLVEEMLAAGAVSAASVDILLQIVESADVRGTPAP